MPRPDVVIEALTARAFTIPTDQPEADGTIAWASTTLIVVEAAGGGKRGLGYTYASPAVCEIVNSVLARVVVAADAFAIRKRWHAMCAAVRNFGGRGVCANAISAVDVALWDLKARLLDLPLAKLMSGLRESVPIYGSGGFTTYTLEALREQLGGWAGNEGCRWVKMKIGMHPEHDLERIRAARAAIGTAELMIDANGAFERKQALLVAEKAACIGVVWFEEPVSSDDLGGLRLLRNRSPGGLEIAAGEYGYDIFYFRRMLEAGAVDVLQADATRCGGYTGFLEAAALADAHSIPLSAHTAPALHLPVCCAAPRLRHIEWFYDHARIEHMLFDGAPIPSGGEIQPDLSALGHGLVFKEPDAARFAV